MNGSRAQCVSVLSIIAITVLSISCGSRSSSELPEASGTSSAEEIAKAEQFYEQRQDLMRVREGIVALRQAVTIDPGSYEGAWRLAKFNYYLATHTDHGDERDKAFRAGIEAGKTAVQLADNKPDGHFWLGANYGGAAQESAIAGLSTVGDIRSEMEKVLQLDQGYQNGSAYMVLGLVYLNAPKFVGGDPQKAVGEMEKGLRFGPTNAFLHLHLAEAYAKVGRHDDARQQLNSILAMTPDQDYLPEYREASEQAHKLLDAAD